METSLRKGGADGRFSLPPLADGGGTGFNDLRRFGAPYDFIGQAVHVTAARGYRDTVNLAVTGESRGARLRAFSISDIGGALGDSGQNRRNIELLLQGIDVTPDAAKVVFGCGKK